jgi:hypothetical protein
VQTVQTMQIVQIEQTVTFSIILGIKALNNSKGTRRVKALAIYTIIVLFLASNTIYSYY